MVFNKNYGDFSRDLPFDLEKRRITPFTIRDKNDSNGKAELSQKLSQAIQLIVKNKPKKPAVSSITNEKQIKRDKDVASLKILMACIHVPTFDAFISYLPHHVIQRIFFFAGLFNEHFESGTFYIYDDGLRRRLRKFATLWNATLSHGSLYVDVSNGGEYYKFIGNLRQEEIRTEYANIEKEADSLKQIYKILISFIKKNYLEVDIDSLSQQAIQSYEDHEKTWADKFEKSNARETR